MEWRSHTLSVRKVDEDTYALLVDEGTQKSYTLDPHKIFPFNAEQWKHIEAMIMAIPQKHARDHIIMSTDTKLYYGDIYPLAAVIQEHLEKVGAVVFDALIPLAENPGILRDNKHLVKDVISGLNDTNLAELVQKAFPSSHQTQRTQDLLYVDSDNGDDSAVVDSAVVDSAVADSAVADSADKVTDDDRKRIREAFERDRAKFHKKVARDYTKKALCEKAEEMGILLDKTKKKDDLIKMFITISLDRNLLSF